MIPSRSGGVQCPCLWLELLDIYALVHNCAAVLDAIQYERLYLLSLFLLCSTEVTVAEPTAVLLLLSLLHNATVDSLLLHVLLQLLLKVGELFKNMSWINIATTVVLWPYYRSVCVSQQELKESVGAKFYCLHAFAHGTRIRKNMLEFSSLVYLHHIHACDCSKLWMNSSSPNCERMNFNQPDFIASCSQRVALLSFHSVCLSVGSRTPLSSEWPLLSVSMSVCLSVCLSAPIHPLPVDRFGWNLAVRTHLGSTCFVLSFSHRRPLAAELWTKSFIFRGVTPNASSPTVLNLVFWYFGTIES